jgi:methionine sulfoxide reductase catalytic subunit
MPIRIRSAADIPSHEITPESVYLDRRRFLGTLPAAAAAIVAAPSLAAGCTTDDDVAQSGDDTSEQQPDPRFRPDPGDRLNSYDDITSYNNFYEFGTDKADPKRNAHTLRPRPWSVAVNGHVARPAVYDLEDFVSPHTLIDRVYRLRCVEGWSMVIPWRGFQLRDLVERVAPTSRAAYIEFLTLKDERQMPGQRSGVLDWPYVEGLRLDEAMNPLTLMVTGLYGRELPNQNGAPLRLIVPWKYGFKSIKSIVAMRFVERQPTTSWMRSAPREYGFYANVNPSVDHPRWSQKTERRLGELRRRDTLMFNGYGEQVASMYTGMDLRRNY